MRTIVIFILCVFISLNTFTQIKVISSGKVGIGTSTPSYGILQLGKDGSNNGLSLYQSSTGGSVFSVYRKGDYGYLTRAGYDTRGLRIAPTGKLYLYTNETTNYSSTFISVANNNLNLNYVVMPASTGTYTFYVQGDGKVYHSGLYTISDSTEKKDITDIDNSLNKVLKLHGVYYRLKEHNSYITNDSLLLEGENNTFSSEYKSMNESLKNTLAQEKQRKEMGLIAQEVEKVIPEVVRSTYDGRKTISYQSLVGLLIEAIKEQQIQIEELKNIYRYSDYEIKSSPSFDSKALLKKNMSNYALLYQNKPNPFTENTKILYYLSENINSATLYIYNMQGSQIKCIPLNDRGESNVIINGNELQAGIYIYALIADGIEIATKHMILTD